MTIWQTIARDFNWKPLFGSRLNYPCGATQGWARPVSIDPSCSQWENAGCVCHTDLERSIMDWRRKLVSDLLDRVFQISREAGVTVQLLETNGRQQWFDQALPDRLQPVLAELEGMQERLELLQLRIRLQRDLRGFPTREEREQRYEPIDRPAPLAGPTEWTDKVYKPR